MYKKITKSRNLVLYAWIVCGLAALFYCYEYLLRIEPSVMTDSLMRNFALTAEGLGLLTAMYYYAYTPLQALVGVITDYFGPKWVLTAAIGFCAIGSWLFGATHDVYLAGLGRFMIGFGSAFAFVGILKLAAMWLPKNRFALFVGITVALGMLGAMVGDIGMTWAVEHFGWVDVVFASAMVGAVLIPIFLFFVHDKKARIGDKQHLVYNVRNAVAGLVSAFKNPQLILAGFIGSMLYLSLSVFGELWGIPFLTAAVHQSRIFAAELNSMVFFGWLIGAPIAGWMSDYFKTRRMVMLLGSLLAAAAISVVVIDPRMNSDLLFPMLFLFGLFASVQVNVFAVARDHVPLKYAATAMGVVNLFIMLGGMILQPLFGWFLTLFWHGQRTHGVPVYRLVDYQHALIILPIAMLVSAILAYFLKESYTPSSGEHHA